MGVGKSDGKVCNSMGRCEWGGVRGIGSEWGVMGGWD